MRQWVLITVARGPAGSLRVHAYDYGSEQAARNAAARLRRKHGDELITARVRPVLVTEWDGETERVVA